MRMINSFLLNIPELLDDRSFDDGIARSHVLLAKNEKVNITKVL